MTRRLFATAMFAAAIVAMAPVTYGPLAESKNNGRSERDHDEALHAREDGSVLTLTQVLAIVGPKIDGEIIETEFEYEGGIPVYEFKYVNRKGQVREFYADARTGAILKDEPD